MYSQSLDCFKLRHTHNIDDTCIHPGYSWNTRHKFACITYRNE